MVDFLIENFLKQEYAESTKYSYRSQLKAIETYLKSLEKPKTMKHLTLDDVRTFYKHKQQLKENPWDSSSVYTFIAIIKRYAKWRMKQISRQRVALNRLTHGEERDRLQGIIHDFEDITDFKRPKLKETIKLETPITTDIMTEMFKIMLEDTRDPHHINFKTAWCIWWFGCRPGELVSINTDEDISLIEQRITFLTEKTNKQRFGFFDDFTGNILSDFKTNPNRINVDPTTAWRRISKYSKQLKGDIKLYPRLGRRCFITFMDGRGFNDKDLMAGYPVSQLDDKFLKLLCGHTISGMNDITQAYKVYPPLLQKAYILKYHYMRDLEDLLKKYI